MSSISPPSSTPSQKSQEITNSQSFSSLSDGNNNNNMTSPSTTTSSTIFTPLRPILRRDMAVLFDGIFSSFVSSEQQHHTASSESQNGSNNKSNAPGMNNGTHGGASPTNSSSGASGADGKRNGNQKDTNSQESSDASSGDSSNNNHSQQHHLFISSHLLSNGLRSILSSHTLQKYKLKVYVMYHGEGNGSDVATVGDNPMEMYAAQIDGKGAREFVTLEEMVSSAAATATISSEPTLLFWFREHDAPHLLPRITSQIIHCYTRNLLEKIHIGEGENDGATRSSAALPPKAIHVPLVNRVHLIVTPSATLRLHHFLRENRLAVSPGNASDSLLLKQYAREMDSSAGSPPARTGSTSLAASSTQALLTPSQRQTSLLYSLLQKHNISITFSPSLHENTLSSALFFYDDDLLTLQFPDAWKLIQLNRDRQILYEMARVLSKLELLFVNASNSSISQGRRTSLASHNWSSITWKGDASQQIVHMMKQMSKQMGKMQPNADNAGAPFSNSDSSSEQQSGGADTSGRKTHLILVDRNVDSLSPLLTGHTYEALVDELFGVEFGGHFTPQFQPCIPDGKPGESVTLDHSDRAFSAIRDMHVDVLGKRLKRIGESLQEKVEQRKSLETIQDIKAYTEQLPNLQRDMKSYAMHLNIIQQLRKLTSQHEFQQLTDAELNICKGKKWKQSKKYISECIAKQDPLVKVLRLLCLASQAAKTSKFPHGGLPATDYAYFRNEIIETYGYHQILTLQSLERLRLFMPLDSYYVYHQDSTLYEDGDSSSTAGGNTSTRSSLFSSTTSSAAGTLTNLNYYFQLEAKPKDKDPDPFVEDPADIDFDPHRIYPGNRAPLSVQVIQKLLSGISATGKEWKGIQDALQYVPGQLGREGHKKDQQAQLHRPLVVVVYVGGICLEEMNALRGLNRINEERYLKAMQEPKSQTSALNFAEYVVLSTNVFHNNNGFISSFIDGEEDE